MFLVLRVKTYPGVGSIHRNAHTRHQDDVGVGGELPSRAGNKRLQEGVFSAILIITKLYSQL